MAGLFSTHRWEVHEIPREKVLKLSDSLGISKLAAHVLVARGFDDKEEVAKFLTPSLERDAHDPYLIPGLADASQRVFEAIKSNERIAIFGDFDVDGLSATAVLTQALRELGVSDVKAYIPKRFDEGYGLSQLALKRVLEDAQPQLLITVDTGIAADQAVAWLLEHDVDVVVTDHHEPSDSIPKHVPVVNPKLDKNCPSFDLAGVGVALKLVHALGEKLGKPNLWREFIDLAALGTIADMMELSTENRALVYEGVEKLKTTKRYGLKALMDISGVSSRSVTADNLGFSIIPRLNAAGRISDPEIALNLLLATSKEEAEYLAADLESINEQRKEIEGELIQSVQAKLDAKDEDIGRVIVLGDEGWHEGVKGIVASRLVRRYKVPALLFSISDGVARGSGRTSGSINLFEALQHCDELFTQFGGHAAAVGITCDAENLEPLKNCLEQVLSTIPEEDFEETGVVDAIVELSDIDMEGIASLDDLKPFGQGNPVPKLALRGVTMSQKQCVGRDKAHLSFHVTDGLHSVDAIMFRAPNIKKLLDYEGAVDLVFEAQNEYWRGVTRPKLMVKDILLRDIPVQLDNEESSESKYSIEEQSQLVSNLFSKADEILNRDEYKSVLDADYFNTKVVGVTFEGRQELLSHVHDGDVLKVVRDTHNLFDENAIAIKNENDEQLGFINRHIAKALAPSMDNGIGYVAQVTQVTGKDKDTLGLNIRVSKKDALDVKDDAEAKKELAIRKAIARREKLIKLDDDEMLREIKNALIGEDAQIYPAQKESLDLLNEGKSVLTVMATGRGKSFIFQAHAARIALRDKKASVFVYPLRALINDQKFHLMESFSKLGLSVRVLSGETALGGRDYVFEELNDGTVDVILTTPEFLVIHKDRFAQSGRIGFLVIDEAHHAGSVSQTRAAYKEMPEVLAAFNNPTVLAVTATASTSVAEKIKELLNIDEFVLDLSVRHNLLMDDGRNTPQRDRRLVSIVARGEKTIIYVNSRDQSVSIARMLRKCIGELGHKIAFYNAGLTRKDRLLVEDAFRSDKLVCVVATSAFGEGVNLPNVRHVVLYHMPFGEVEFNQVSGRAGRDNEDAWIHLLFGAGDARINERIIEASAPERVDLMALYRALMELGEQAAQEQNLFIETTAPFSATNAEIATHASARDPRAHLDEKSVSCGIGVFRELGFLETRGYGISREIVMEPNPQKKDLTSSIRYLEGMHLRDDFLEFKDWMLTTDAEELLRRINRPITP